MVREFYLFDTLPSRARNPLPTRAFLPVTQSFYQNDPTASLQHLFVSESDSAPKKATPPRANVLRAPQPPQKLGITKVGK